MVSPGDVVAINLGFDLPIVLRPTGKAHYQVVGEGYVHGIMDGELMKDSAVREFNIC